ncbi:hypothetical protein EG68_06361 [Paragonimus skrjabini miyazakii]|uniref:peptidylglycine monooxygenase n=1 Tax=Paragonimus skrjabini miyazakii TaxID=59628 RepID=A0A8S9YQG2_9TREM|nr:hypothetical protein EG68_06361 [Paragonimus skrjabini miyazakii]
MWNWRISTVLWLIATVTLSAIQAAKFDYEFRMPGVRTQKDDAYLCYGELIDGNTSYITGFKPIHDEEVTHHMILFGCNEPGSEEKVWTCGGGPMSDPVCKETPTIIFSWAMNAPSFTMPPDTSFPIGGDGYKYLILQVHYKDASAFQNAPEKKDTSGWKLSMQTTPTKYLAGVYLFVTDGQIEPNGETVIQVACRYTGSAVLHPIAFRVHAHSHGVVNEAFLFHNGKRYLIGSKSPQEKQTFYPVENKTLTVHPGDVMMARCNMTNHENRVIYMGNTRKDEMCNFYMMYAVDSADVDQLHDRYNQQCFSDENANLNLNSFIDESQDESDMDEDYDPYWEF